MVTFQIASDLHLETFKETPIVNELITPSSEILILAGDIGRIHKIEQVRDFLKQVSVQFKIILYVPGNQEYYKVDGIPPEDIKTIDEKIQSLTEEIPNLIILNRNSIVIENVCIIGCTLWSNPINGVPPQIVKIKDINTLTYTSMFFRDLEFIEAGIKYAKENNYKLLVVTHHAPLIELAGRGNFRYKSLYSSDLEYLMKKSNVHTWVFGHTHHNFDFITKHGTRIVSNQKGKMNEKVYNFVKDKIIKL